MRPNPSAVGERELTVKLPMAPLLAGSPGIEASQDPEHIPKSANETRTE